MNKKQGNHTIKKWVTGNLLTFTTASIRFTIVVGCLSFFLTVGPLPTRQVQAQATGIFGITLGEMGYSDRVLEGAAAQTQYYFSLPANWDPQADSYLKLNLEYTAIDLKDDTRAILEVKLNNKTLRTESFEAPSEFQLWVAIPPDALYSVEDRRLNMLQLSLVYDECETALRASLTVRKSSSLYFNYIERPLTLDLAEYPKPIYYDWVLQTSPVRFVFSPALAEVDLQTAIIVAAQLGELTREKLPLVASFSSSLPPMAEREEHFLIIGQPKSNTLIQQLDLPLALVERQLDLRSEMPAMIAPAQAFTLTLTVKNTSSISRELALEDHWPAGTSLLACRGQCEEIAPNGLLWQIGRLSAGQEISTEVQILLDPSSVVPGEKVEHTASLLTSEGSVINVDTLTAEVGAMDDKQTVASAPDKSRYFFGYNNRGVAEGDGIIQEIISPWSASHVVIVVTGLSDEAVLRAGQALGLITQSPGVTGPYAIIRTVRPSFETAEQPVADMTFASLGYGDEVVDALFNTAQYTFRMPREWELTENASIALHFAHGAMLNVVSATLEIALNQMPIHSFWLDEHNTSDTWYIIPLSGNRLKVGSNQLDFRLSGDFDVCIDKEFAERLWLSIYSDSFLHLPYRKTGVILNLADFPQPFGERHNLENVVFLMPERPGVVEVEGALTLAASLGNATGGSYFIPQVVLGGTPEQATWQGNHAIALGRPTVNPYIAAANDFLPQPFIPGTDEIRQQVGHIIYRLSPDYSLGYIQLLPSPWGEDHAMLVVTGSTNEGVTWALDALTNDALSYKLDGNLVTIVQEGNLHATDTRKPENEKEAGVSYSELGVVMTPEATVTPTSVPATATPVSATATVTPMATDTPAVAESSRPIWLIPLLLVSLLGVVVFVGIAIWQARSQ